MPEIPQSLGPSVRRAPLPTPLTNPGMASAAAFGAPIAEGAQRGADIAYRAKQQADDDRDTIEAMDGMNQFLVADHQKMTEYRSRTGANAKGLIDEAAVDYQKRQDEFEKQITSPRVKEKFRQMTAARWAQRNSGMLIEHQRDQMRAYEADTLGATIKNIHLDGLNDGTDDAIANAERMSALTYQRLADMQGADPQTRDLALRANAATLYGAAIEQDIDADNWQGAKARLDKFGDRIDKPQRDQLERKIREGGLNQRAQDTVDTMFKSGYAVTKADVDRMVSVEKDADLRGRIQIKADQEWNRREEALKIARGKTYGEIAKAADEGADPEALIVKHEDAAALTQEDKDHLRGIAARRARRQEPPAGSPDYYALRRAASIKPEQFVAEDLNLWRGLIPEPERQGLIELQADMLGRPTPGSKEGRASSLLSVADIAAEGLRMMKINGATEKGERDPRADRFENLLDRAIEAEGGTKNLSNTQIREIRDRLIKEETRTVAAGGVGKFINVTGMGLPGMLFGIGTDGTEKVRAFEQEGADAMAFSFGQVPQSEIPKIIEALTKSGTDPKYITEDAILTTYSAAKAKAAK